MAAALLAEITECQFIRELDMGRGDRDALFRVGVKKDGVEKRYAVCAASSYGGEESQIAGVLALPKPKAIISALQLCMQEMTVGNLKPKVGDAIAALSYEKFPKLVQLEFVQQSCGYVLDASGNDVVFQQEEYMAPVFKPVTPEQMFQSWKHKFAEPA